MYMVACDLCNRILSSSFICATQYSIYKDKTLQCNRRERLRVYLHLHLKTRLKHLKCSQKLSCLIVIAELLRELKSMSNGKLFQMFTKHSQKKAYLVRIMEALDYLV